MKAFRCGAVVIAWRWSLLLVCLAMPAICAAQNIADLLAPRPPMGWNSWNKFACNVSEDLIK
jgi:alpha-galactosidase